LKGVRMEDVRSGAGGEKSLNSAKEGGRKTHNN